MSSMRDVAKRAGVSVSTVSRVLNKGIYVDRQTERRVREAIAELGYRPNLLARSFRRKETRTIGLLVPDNTNPFFAWIARVIEDAGFAEGYSVILCNSDLSETKQAAYVDVLLAKQVDGLILVSSGLIPSGNGQAVTERIIQAAVPSVIVDRDLGTLPIDQVLVDQYEGGYGVGAYLIGLGHRRIACLLGPDDRTASAGRSSGFRRAMRDAGVEIDPAAIIRGNGRFDGGVAATEALLRNQVEFTAIFAFNDVMAIGSLHTLHRYKRQVPDDVSVVGFDDILMASAVIPPLTTVAQPVSDMGHQCVQLLLNRINNREAPAKRIVLPTKFVERESSGPPMTKSERKQ